MKATLEFDLTEESDAYCAAVDGADIMNSVRDLDRFLRSTAKYGTMPNGAPATAELQQAAEQWRTVLRETLEVNGVAWVLE